MKILPKQLLKFWPIAFLVGIEVILFLTNYKPGTFLMGWDNVMPEFNFKANVIRSIVGVWQEHRGLGLYDGMSHISLLPHIFFLWILSLAFPLNLLRYIFTFLAHLMGGIGTYLLLINIFESSNIKGLKLQLSGFVGVLFYEFNIATILMFYTPLESFSVHFAALPWTALTLSKYLKSKSKVDLFSFVLTLFFTTPQYFVTTLFIPITILIGSFLLHHLIISPNKKTALKTMLVIFTTFLAVNSYWLLPYVYGLPQNAPQIKAAKINQMSSDEVFARNKAFGDIKNVLLFRGFALESEDLYQNNSNDYLMLPWRFQFNFIPTTLASLLTFIAISGIGVSIYRKQTNMLVYIIPFILGFLMLANNTLIIEQFNSAIRTLFPIFAEAFRFPFTKFSLLFVFSVTVFLTYGIIIFLNLFSKYSKIIYVFIPLFGIIFYLANPAFRGNFIYKNERITLPNEYFQTWKYFKDQNPNTRIAILPQSVYWSWKFYQFGYRGSGFFWYGLNQPLLDRAFDPWSNTNEQYYWELSHALYSKNADELENVFDKYDVSYIVLDKNIIASTNNKSLFIDEAIDLLNKSPLIDKVAEFGRIEIYKRKNQPSSFTEANTYLTKVSSQYMWLDTDQVFERFGDYINSDQSGYFFPFRSLFTKRSVNERPFSISETENTIKIQSNQIVPRTYLRSVTLDSDISLDENGNFFYTIEKSKDLVFNTNEYNILIPSNVYSCGGLRDGKTKANNITINSTNVLQLSAQNQRACMSFDAPLVNYSQAYLVSVTTKNVSGRPLNFSIINNTYKHIELETTLTSYDDEDQNQFQTDYFILPPLTQDGLGYTMYFANDAIGSEIATNQIVDIKMYQIPYEQLINRKFTNEAQITNSDNDQPRIINSKHDLPNYYKVQLRDVNARDILLLSQEYNPGWLAFAKTNSFPYFQKLNNHVLVNNWENGWELGFAQDKNIGTMNYEPRTIYIFFWPQLLEFLGFALMIFPFIYLWRKK